MPIYVDALMARERTPRWRFDTSCHMFCEPGELDQLHAFAQALGIPRRAFQPREGLPHYDLYRELRMQALEMGALPAERRFVVDTIRRWRAVEAGPNVTFPNTP
ncbi:MAG TPA: DUF4031 domain-containing protein [Candidatus Methylacidiphilales bacterium]|nr:DUF4031 domain-containing protein [Candidatus Methylacidiphilales bacterium]